MGIYQQIYDIITNYIYGGVSLTSDMTLTATLLSTAISVACFSLPIVLVYKFIRWCF